MSVVFPLQRSKTCDKFAKLCLHDGKSARLIVAEFMEFADIELVVRCAIEEVGRAGEVEMFKDEFDV